MCLGFVVFGYPPVLDIPTEVNMPQSQQHDQGPPNGAVMPTDVSGSLSAFDRFATKASGSSHARGFL